MGFEIGLLGLPFLVVPLAGTLVVTLALRNHYRTPDVVSWLLFFWLQMAGNTLFIFRTPGLEPFFIPLRNTCWIAGTGLLWRGCALYSGRRASLARAWMPLVLALPIQAYFAYLSPNVPARGRVLFGFLAFLYGAAAAALWRGPRRPVSRTRRFGSLLLAVYSLFYAWLTLRYVLAASAQYLSLEGPLMVLVMIFLTFSLLVLQTVLWALAQQTSAGAPS